MVWTGSEGGKGMYWEKSVERGAARKEEKRDSCTVLNKFIRVPSNAPLMLDRLVWLH